MGAIERLIGQRQVRIRKPTCSREVPKFEKLISEIRSRFGDQLIEKPFTACGREWISFQLVELLDNGCC